LNNRSMGTDTECDLAVEATSTAERRSILAVRNRLIADHCGVTPDDVVACLERTGSLAALADELGYNGHALRPVADGEPIPGELAGYSESLADPEQPIGADAFFEGVFGNGHRRRGPVLKLAAAAALIVSLALAWHSTPLSQVAEIETVRGSLAAF